MSRGAVSCPYAIRVIRLHLECGECNLLIVCAWLNGRTNIPPPLPQQALARAMEEGKGGRESPSPSPDASHGNSVQSMVTGETKLQGAPPASVTVALRADSVSEGRRDVVRAMFEVAWWPMLGAFSQVKLWT